MSKFNTTKVVYEHGPMGWVLFMAYIGAFIHFFNQAPHFWGFIVAIFKAAVWPGYVIYAVLGMLGIK